MSTEVDICRYQGGIADRRRTLPRSLVEAGMHFETCIEMREPHELHETLNRLSRYGEDRTSLARCVGAAVEYLASDRSRVAYQLVGEMVRPATRDEIKRELHVLVGSFPNAGKADLELYGRALALDVIDIEPTIEAIIVACMVLRRQSKFLPTISEVLSWVQVIDGYVVHDRFVLSKLPSLVEQSKRTTSA